MAYLTQLQLESLGFKKLGKNVRISDRVAIYNADQIEIGDNVRIDDFCVLSGRITLGNFVFIGVFSNIAGGEAGIEMKDFVTLSYNIHIFAQSDDYSGKTLTSPMVPRKYKNEIKEKILIERQVIIGAGSMVLPGVVIKEGCSIGSMSLISKSTQPWKVYVGTPAKPIKDREKRLLELEKEFLRETID